MEYEYCYKVDDLKDYLSYIENNYKFQEKYHEERIIYRNKDKIARISSRNGEIFLSFKENKISDSDLTVRKESMEIKVDSLKKCEDILKFLDYKKDNVITRIRSVFVGEGIKFEVDEYMKPEKSFILSFEGKKRVCDALNMKFVKLNNIHKIK